MAGQSPNFDWSIVSTLLNPSSNIPGDVKFQVMDRDGKVVVILEAHKIILALHSAGWQKLAGFRGAENNPPELS